MTVAELIEQLRALPQDAPVYIDDADTGWHLPLSADGVRFEQENAGSYYGDGVLLRARYHDTP